MLVLSERAESVDVIDGFGMGFLEEGLLGGGDEEG